MISKQKLKRIWLTEPDYKRLKAESDKNHRTTVGQIAVILDLYFKKPLKP